MGNIKISKLNPILFHHSTDEKFTVDRVPDHEERRGYCQKYYHGDTPYIQVLTDDLTSVMSMALIDNDGTVYKSWLLWFSGLMYDGYYVYHWYNYLPFANVAPEGMYFLRLYVNDMKGDSLFYSEPIYLSANTGKDGMVRVIYSHDENDFYRRFTGNVNPSVLWVEGGVKSDGETPGGKFDMFQDIDYNSVLLHSAPYLVEKWTFGDGGGIPNWLGDKLNRIFGLSDVTLNGVAYSRNEGAKLSRVGDNDYPLAAFEIDLVKSDNPMTDDYLTEPTPLTVDTTEITCDNTLITSDQTQY